MKTGSVVTFGMTTKRAFTKEDVETEHFLNALNKPVGGLWLSPMAGEKSEWVRFCEKEMPDWIQGSHHYEVELTVDGIRFFTSPPKRDEMEEIMSDNECNGFFLIGVHFSWDAQSLWLKDDRNFISIKKKEMLAYETA